LGVTERTIHTYRKKPAVMRAVLRAQEDYMSEGGGRGVSSVPEAVQTLTDIMNDPQARDSDRIAASRALMNGAAAYQERKVLERKLRDLETLLVELTGSTPEYEEDTTPVTFDDLDPLLPSAAVPEDET
jgi:hypothetical protein